MGGGGQLNACYLHSCQAPSIFCQLGDPRLFGLTICGAQGAKVSGNQATEVGVCEEGQEGPEAEEVCMWERLLGQA